MTLCLVQEGNTLRLMADCGIIREEDGRVIIERDHVMCSAPTIEQAVGFLYKNAKTVNRKVRTVDCPDS